MIRTIVTCNLCGNEIKAANNGAGLVKDDYGARADQYHRVPITEATIHICAFCESALVGFDKNEDA